MQITKLMTKTTAEKKCVRNMPTMVASQGDTKLNKLLARPNKLRMWHCVDIFLFQSHLGQFTRPFDKRE